MAGRRLRQSSSHSVVSFPPLLFSPSEFSLRVLPPSSPSEFSPTSAWCSPSLPSLWWSLLVNPLVQFSTPSSILLLTVPVWSRHFPEFTPCRQFVTLVPPFDCPSLSHQSPAQSEVISRLVSVLSSLSAQPASPLHCACLPLLTRHAHTHRDGRVGQILIDTRLTAPTAQC